MGKLMEKKSRNQPLIKRGDNLGNDDLMGGLSKGDNIHKQQRRKRGRYWNY